MLYGVGVQVPSGAPNKILERSIMVMPLFLVQVIVGSSPTVPAKDVCGCGEIGRHARFRF